MFTPAHQTTSYVYTSSPNYMLCVCTTTKLPAMFAPPPNYNVRYVCTTTKLHASLINVTLRHAYFISLRFELMLLMSFSLKFEHDVVSAIHQSRTLQLAQDRLHFFPRGFSISRPDRHLAVFFMYLTVTSTVSWISTSIIIIVQCCQITKMKLLITSKH